MAIIVEDGTGVADANSYATVAEADAYFTQRGNAAWAALTDDKKQQSLIQATEYADIRWGDDLRSRPLLSTQALEMPRRNLHDRYGEEIEGLPRDWVRGVFEYAVEASQNNLFNNAVRREDQELKSQRVTVGPITRSNTFVTNSENKPVNARDDNIVYPLADQLCRKFIIGFGLGGRVIRG